MLVGKFYVCFFFSQTIFLADAKEKMRGESKRK